MPDPPPISDAEWDVMKAIWDAPSPLTAGQIVQRLQGDRAPRTIKTLLGRLVKKGAVSVQVLEGRHLYRPAVTRDACRRAESRSFLSRVFDNQAAPALMHLLKETRLTRREIDELRKLLEQGGRK